MTTLRSIVYLAAVALVLAITVNGASIPECPEHSTFNGCMTRCPVTCSNLANPPTNCISVCTVGCECMEGFVKVNKGPTSQCVKAYECPMYSKQQTLPYPVLRKLAAAASVPSSPVNLNLTTLPMVTKSSSARTSTIPISVLKKAAKQTPEENESHEQ